MTMGLQFRGGCRAGWGHAGGGEEARCEKVWGRAGWLTPRARRRMRSAQSNRMTSRVLPGAGGEFGLVLDDE